MKLSRSSDHLTDFLRSDPGPSRQLTGLADLGQANSPPVKIKKSTSAIDGAAARLRELALASPEGTMLGSEDEIVSALGVSRVTIRQAARLLEREGALLVRRGKNGGYFAARPSVEIIEAVVCAYLNTLGLGIGHTGVVASALWVEALREAAGADREAAAMVANQFAKEIEDLDPEAPIEEVSKLERKMRSAVFELIDGAYIELIFHINAAFARQRVTGWDTVEPESHRVFVHKWKQAKLMELEAIAEGNMLQAVAAGLHDRTLWVARGSDTRQH